MARKSPQSLGYNIPVKIKISDGRYKSGYVKSLKPDARGNLRICYRGSWRKSSVDAKRAIHEPKGFNVLDNISDSLDISE